MGLIYNPNEFSYLYEIYRAYPSWSDFLNVYPLAPATQIQFLQWIEQAETIIAQNQQNIVWSGKILVQEEVPAVIYSSLPASDALVVAEQSGLVATGGPPAAVGGSAAVVGAAGGFSFAGLLTAGIWSVNCGLAALIGYNIGTELYETNPQLAEEIFQTILPWTFDLIDKQVGVVDYNGKTYIDARIFEAMKAKLASLPKYEYQFEFNGHIQGSNKLNPGLNVPFQFSFTELATDQYNNQISVQSTVSGSYTALLNNVYTWVEPIAPQNGLTTLTSYIVFASNLPFNLTYHGPSGDIQNISALYDSTYKVYYRYYLAISDNRIVISSTVGGSIPCEDLGSYTIPQVAASLINSQKAEMPEGVSFWNGQKVSDPYNGSIDVVILPDGTTTPYIPFSLPGYNDITLDSSTNPNPQQYTSPSSQVQPYGQNSPFSTLAPSPDVSSDPETNPSESTETQPSTSTPTPTTPGDSGTSPTIPTNPTPAPFDPSASTPSGLINVYNPTPQQLYDFGAWLWVTYSNLTIQKIFNNPFDGVISLHEIYFTPVTGSSQNIRSGFLDSNISADTVPQRYSELNCGSIVLPEYFGNYLDYSPYTKVYIYLPFIGIEELDAEDVIGAAINVTYGVDSYSGACVAMVTTAKDGYNAVTYQFTGNASVSHPMSGGSQAQNLIAMCTTLGSTVIGAVTGGLSGAVTSGFGSLAGDMTSVKSSVYHSGTFTGNFGAMACKTPYLIVKRPKQVVVPNYNEFYGYPAHKYVRLGSCTGYVRCREVHVNSARATNEEKQRIEELLKSGVFLT